MWKRQGIREELCKERVKEKEEKSEIYRYRWRIENVNGNIKEKMERHIRVRRNDKNLNLK